jgi:hypothetical protein
MELLRVEVGAPELSDLAFGDKLLQRTERVGNVDGVVGVVELIQVVSSRGIPNFVAMTTSLRFAPSAWPKKTSDLVAP